jgi:glycosidase
LTVRYDARAVTISTALRKSAWSPDVPAAFHEARAPRVGTAPFPSPQDWRDVWIYFLLLDRFNNPNAPPQHSPWDGSHNIFQGGTFNGVRQQLGYLKDLGVGAIWLSPVMKNCQYDPHAYHGYGIQDFMAVEPRFASDPEQARRDPSLAERELRELVDAAHAKGIYVIFDIVLNHTGDVFAYATTSGDRGEAPWRDDGPYPIRWREADGRPRADWSDAPGDPPTDAAVWPEEIRRNEFFRRQGNAFSRPGELSEQAGDFFSLKELVTGFASPSPAYRAYYPVRDALIRAYQFVIAKYDVDGFRIDTLKFIEPDFSLVFGNAMREFALSIGKKNFFTFGEVYDDEDKIARFIGRSTHVEDDMIGVDAALDFPLFFKLPKVAKGQLAPSEVIALFERRKQVQRGLIGSHGETSQFFVTFLDNHDMAERFYYSDPNDPHRYDGQLTLGLTCMFALQGIPCVYYGAEQGCHGHGSGPEAVREALWGKGEGRSRLAFDPKHPFFGIIKQLTAARNAHPALRYGRQYFRPISGNGADFGASTMSPGVLAFSRILNDMEVVVVANTNTQAEWQGEVIVDYALNPIGTTYQVIFSNVGPSETTVVVADKPSGAVRVTEMSGAITHGPARVLRVSLQPMEAQILAR